MDQISKKNYQLTTNFRVKDAYKLTNVGGVVRRAKDQFGRPVVARTDIADVRLAGDQNLCRSEVTKLEHSSCRVEKQVLRLDIPVANADRMNVHQGAEELVHVQLDLQHGHGLLELCVVATCAVHGFGDVFQYKIEIHFIFLWRWESVELFADALRPYHAVCKSSPCRHLSRRRLSNPPHSDAIRVS